jgi:hypothetical protein
MRMSIKVKLAGAFGLVVLLTATGRDPYLEDIGPMHRGSVKKKVVNGFGLDMGMNDQLDGEFERM